MKTIGIISEFNPFHNGHEYFLNTIRKLSGADKIICIMSGDFVQRGAPAVFDKYERTLHALKGGADLVLELPVRYALGSAEIFAKGAVSLLNKLGCVDELWFGSECGNIEDIQYAARLLDNESYEFKEALHKNLSEGLSYPLARANAYEAFYGKELSETISSPNNILGIEYSRAIVHFCSKIVPKTIKRKGAGYNELDSDALYCSAAAIREMIAIEPGKALSKVPEFVQGSITAGQIVEADDFSLILREKLLRMSAPDIGSFRDIPACMANRIYRFKHDFFRISDLTEIIKARNYTQARISRALFSIILGIKEDTLYNDTAVRMLGHSDSADLFSRIRETSSIALSSKFGNEFGETGQTDIYASELYDTVKSSKYGLPFVREFSKHAPVTCPQ